MKTYIFLFLLVENLNIRVNLGVFKKNLIKKYIFLEVISLNIK